MSWIRSSFWQKPREVCELEEPYCSLFLSRLDGILFLMTTGASRRPAWITYCGKRGLPVFASMPEEMQERLRATKSWRSSYPC